MIESIDKSLCTNCRLCEKICPMDVFEIENDDVYIEFKEDCCGCMQCMYVCPVDAHTFVPGEPKKYDMSNEWQAIKKMMGVTY